MKIRYPNFYRTGALCAALAIGSWASPAAAAPPVMPENTYAVAVIGDLPGMLDRVSELTQTVEPMLTTQTIRAQLGRLLNDDNLQSIPAGAGLMVSVPASGKPMLLLETAPGKAQQISTTLQQRLGLNAKTSGDNLVVAGRTEQALNNDAATSAAADLLKSNDDKFLRILVDADRAVADHGQKLRETTNRTAERLKQRGDKHSTPSITMMKMATNFMLAVGKRIDVFDLKVDISSEGILIERAGYPKNGIRLQQPEGPSATELRTALAQQGRVLLSYDHHLDTQSTFQALGPIFEETITDIGLEPGEVTELRNIYRQAANAYGDAFAGWVTCTPEALNSANIITLNDAEAAAREIKMEVESVNNGAMKKFYALLGKETSATLNENVRQINGQPVNDYSFSKHHTKNGDKKGYEMSGSYVIHDNRMSVTLGNASLDDLVSTGTAATGNARPVAAREVLEDGGFTYLDIYLGALEDVLDQSRAKAIARELGDSAIYHSAYVDEEKLRSLVLIPADFIQNFVRGIREGSRRENQQLRSERMQPEDQQTTSP